MTGIITKRPSPAALLPYTTIFRRTMSSRSSKDKQTSQSSKGHHEDDNAPITDPSAPPTEADSIHPSELDFPPLTAPPPPVKNAFSVLLSSAKSLSTANPPPQPPDPTKRTHTANWRSTLLPYTLSPESHPPTIVLRHTPTFVTIFDAFPKSTLHLLLLPRDPHINTLHPITALNTHPALLTALHDELAILTPLIQKELHRRFAHLSLSLSRSPPTPREYTLNIGIHAHPSMTHLHIHILTPDMVSPALKNKKHYNSFTTPFFIPLADFPMAADDSRRLHPGRGEEGAEQYLKQGMRCWRCGKEFGGGFKALKAHLEREREVWLAE